MSTDTPLDEFDEIPDPFAGHDDIDWGRLLDAARHATPDYFPDEEPVDAAFLAQLDLLDGTSSAAPSTSSLAPTPSGSSHSSATTPPSTTSTDFSPLRIRLKRPQTQNPSLSPTGSRTPKKRRKSIDVAPLILTGFEEDMACSICCDIYVATHLLSPCGHSFCGECAWHWTAKINKTDCPLCRTRLAQKPMVPNICMDKMVDTHIQMLAMHGDAAWREGGQKLAEFNARRRKWKDGAAERNKMPGIRTVPPHILDWVESDDSDYGEEDEESGDDEEEDEVGGEDVGENLMGDLRTLSTRELQVLIENLRSATY